MLLYRTPVGNVKRFVAAHGNVCVFSSCHQRQFCSLVLLSQTFYDNKYLNLEYDENDV